ncbi:hypothetical protein [Tolypothrix sp. NIES-4075]|uniref:hypothetical protein n=1 Tax=Tolypothrix sp. NIES-4075 TaxID=2005459 RepID=UPI00135C2E4A|nr:hypothetical protein [Tolypothrix sp. NIES-4075]
MQTADIILPLISSDFIASDFNWNFVVQQAKARNKARTARVVPILLRRVDNWKVAFGNLKVLPEGEKPVTDWKPYDNAFASIAKGIREVVEEINASRSPIQKSLLYISASVKPVANAFGTVASKTVSFASAVLSSPTKISRSRRRNRAGLMPFAKPIIIIAIGSVFIPRLPNILGISSLESKQISSSTQNENSSGWIWIGVINNSSSSLPVGKRLPQTSDASIEPSVVPSKGAIVTVKNTVMVRLRKNRPKTYYSPLPDEVGQLQPGQKVVILKVEPLVNRDSNSYKMKVWAQVRKCNKTCNK